MIVVTTPTGQIGSKVAKSLVEAGEPVTLFCRDAAKLPEALRAGAARVIEGQSDDLNALKEAFQGADQVFWVTPPGATPGGFEPHYVKLANLGAEAIKATGARRIVAVSSGGYPSYGAGPIGALHSMEDAFNAAGVEAGYVRCGCFAENFIEDLDRIMAANELAWPQPAAIKVPVCATKDIAATAVELLRSNDWKGPHVRLVYGPEDLDSNEICSVLGTALERPIKYHEQTDEEYLAESSEHHMPDFVAKGLLAMFVAIRENCYDKDPRDAQATTPTSLLEWAKSELAAEARQRG